MVNNLLNQSHGNLIIISNETISKNRRRHILCQCPCGNIKLIRLSRLQTNEQLSFSCCRKKKYQINDKYGDYCIISNDNKIINDRIYIHCQCICGRGIKICDEWSNFVVFENWAKNHNYNDDLVIDRIDNDGNYSPDNCRWVNRAQSVYNRRGHQKIKNSKYKGVCRKRNKWIATITDNYKSIFIGSYDTEINAALAYNRAALELYREYSCLNQIEGMK